MDNSVDNSIFSPGSILINGINNKLYGVCVSPLTNNKIIVFRLDQNTHPIFSKFQIHPNIIKTGIINEHQNAPLKSALLKHYRTYNLTPSEKTMLRPLMNFAFPLGIPEYQPEVELPERDLKLMDLHSKLNIGTKLFLNTTPKSTYSHLNNKTVKIINKNPDGIWVNLPTNETDINQINNSLYFLFYKNAEIPTFSGISRILPVEITKGKTDTLNPLLLESFNNLNDTNTITTTMQFNGDKVKILPKTKRVIFPETYQNMIYNPHLDTFIVEPDAITPSLASRLGNNIIIANNTPVINLNPDNELVFSNKPNLTQDKVGYTTFLNPEGEFEYEIAEDKSDGLSGGGKSDITKEYLLERNLEESKEWFKSSDSSKDEHNIDDIDAGESVIEIDGQEELEDDDYKDFISSFKRKGLDKKLVTGKLGVAADESDNADTADNIESVLDSNVTDDNETDNETEYDEEEIEIADDDEIEELGTFQKVKRVQVDELEIVYKESIQKGDLFKFKIDKVPALRRNDPIVINNIKKSINIVSLFKNNLTAEGNQLKFTPQDYRPLVDRYIKGDFTNKFLIPLVINKKKIYLDKGKRLQKDEFDKQTHEVIENFYDDLNNLIYLQDKKNVKVDNDTYTNNIINSLNPTVTEESELGLLFRLGEGYDLNDTRKYQQDTITIRYCDKPMKCQSYSLNTLNFDYQVSLGPMGRFLDSSDDSNDAVEIDADEEEERFDRDILSQNPKYKIYYQGDLINIIGYVRPPLKYFNNADKSVLLHMYENKLQKNEVVTVNLEDINPEIIDEEFADKVDLVQNPDQFVMFLLPQSDIAFNESRLENELTKMIPDIDSIASLYLSKKLDRIKGDGTNSKDASIHSIDYIYKVLDKFNYDVTHIPLAIYNRIMAQNEQLLDKYLEFHDNISKHFDKRNKKLKKSAKERAEKHKLEHKTGAAAHYHESHNPKDFKYIEDALFEEVSKFYFETYENQGTSIDSDDVRLRWFLKSFDNGKYFYKSLFMNYLKMYREANNLESLETQFTIMREKFNMTKLDLEAAGKVNEKSSENCKTRTSGPNIIKYPSLQRLEQDNGKVAMDADGSVIIPGDYALVDVPNPNGSGTSKQLYKREIIANNDMWIKDNLEMLYKIIHDKKEQCKNENMELKKDSEICTFNTDDLKCESMDIFAPSKEIHEMEKNIADLQSQIDYLKNIPVLIAKMEKELQNDRSYLLNKLNSDKFYWKHKEEVEEKLKEELEKTIERVKKCIHFDVTDYLFRVNGYGEDRYRIAQSVLKKFENFEDDFASDANVIDLINSDKNYTYCNICNQKLICNHFKYGVTMLEETDKIDYDQIVNKYGYLHNGTYSCQVCGEFIGNTDVQDLEDFAKGDDGIVIKTRELTETTPLLEQRKAYIDNVIKDILASGDNKLQKTEDLDMKVKIYKLLKSLSGLELLSINDEIDMLNFIKSFNFVSRDDILSQIARQQNISALNPAIINKAINKEYRVYATCDIAARFLITLQTARVAYNIVNRDCGVNIIGYPLISNIEMRDGIEYILCLLSQMAILPDYNYLVNFKTEKFIDRLKKQVEDDAFVKTKILDSINNRVEIIDHMNEFNSYYTNNWHSFLPRLSQLQITWQPEKILNDANLKEVTHKNIDRMIEVGYENNIHTSIQLLQNINNIINNSEKTNPMGDIISNSCCKESFGDENPYVYINYFTQRNKNIKDLLSCYKKTDELVTKLKNIKRISVINLIYDQVYKPSQRVLHFDLSATPEEIRSLYLKYIDKGLNKGKQHIFDRYGRCILSNENRIDIASKTYNHQDYIRLENAIVAGNTIDIRSVIQKDVDDTIKLDTIEIKKIKELVSSIPKLDILDFLHEYIAKITESLDIIFSDGNTKQLMQKKADIKGDQQFDIHRHLSNLNKQIDIEINNLIPRLTATDKVASKFERILSNLGYFKNLYEEYKLSHSDYDSQIYRYNKKEEHIQYNIKFLNDIINQIKNNKLSKQVNKENIRPQFREFISFGENAGLFKTLSVSSREIYDFARSLKSKQSYKVLFPEFVSSLLKYLNIISLVNLFNVLNIKKLTKGKAEIVSYKFKVAENVTSNIAPVDMNEGENILMDITNTNDADGNMEPDMDFIESFESKNSDNLKVVGEFVTAYLNKVDDILRDYDALTQDNIAKVIAKHEQKQIEATLKSFEFISREGNEDEYQRLRIKMNILKKVEYRNITEHLKSIFGDDYLETDEQVEEEYDQDGNVIQRVNEMGFDDYEMGQMGLAVAGEDYEGDQDYDCIAVDDD